MFEINVDSNGYYAEGNDGLLVEVEKIPQVDDVRYLTAYKYNDETKELVLDAEKLEDIKAEMAQDNEEAAPSIEERLEALEGVMLDMLAVEGGD